MLNFHLPDISRNRFIWRIVGFEDARRWPLLPLGTMMAGDPIPNIDWRRLSLAYFIFVGPNLDEDTPSREKEENLSRVDKDIVNDFHFALDLDPKPEEEWSPYEKRRMRKISKLISRVGLVHWLPKAGHVVLRAKRTLSRRRSRR